MSHWYFPDGKSCHTVIGKNGKERATTLREARTLRLYKSVTTVLGIQRNDGLINYHHNELIKAAIENPYNPYEWNEDVWKRVVLTKMKEHGKKASDRGTEIHNKLEDYYKTGNVCPIDQEYIIPAIRLIEDTFGKREWEAEATFANAEHGYAGCLDLHCNDVQGAIVLDFKTKDKEKLKGVVQYDDHKMQLAAYQLGLGFEKSRRFNLFISTHEDSKGFCKLVECTEYERYLGMFLLLNEFWSKKNRYNPCSIHKETVV